jgi:hypothetical protein
MPPLKVPEDAAFIVAQEADTPRLVKRSKRKNEATPQPPIETSSCIEMESEFKRLSAELVLNDERIEILN